MIPFSQTVDNYNTYVEEMQGQISEIISLMARTEQNLFSIVENEMRYDLRRTMANFNETNPPSHSRTPSTSTPPQTGPFNSPRPQRYSVLNPAFNANNQNNNNNNNTNNNNNNSNRSRCRQMNSNRINDYYNTLYTYNSPRLTRNTIENRRNRNVNVQERTYEFFNSPDRVLLRRNLDGTTTLHNTRTIPINSNRRTNTNANANGNNGPTAPNFLSTMLPSFLSNVPVRPTEEEINNATEIVRFGSTTNRMQTSCPIGLTPFANNDNVMRILHCGHIFYPVNIRRWFESNVRCPLCRYDIREYNPMTAISNPYNTQIPRNNNSNNNRWAESNSQDDNEGLQNMSPRARSRSNSADGDLETQSQLSRTNSNGNLSVITNMSTGSYTNDLSNSSPTTEELHEEVDSLVSNIVNVLSNSVSNEIENYLRGIIDISNISASDLNDISFNIATITSFDTNDDEDDDDDDEDANDSNDDIQHNVDENTN